MTSSRSRILVFLTLSSVVPACSEAPTQNESKVADISGSTMSAMVASFHGTSITQPASNVTYYVYPSQLASYVVATQTRFWLNITNSNFSGSKWWNRDIRWRPCGTNGAGTSLYTASIPIFPGQAYNFDYIQPASFTPGAYGQYEVLSRSIIHWCPGQFCTDADSVRSSRCVTLADFSVAISGPTSVNADRSATWTAVPAGGAAPLAYQWYKDGVPSGTGQSVTLSTGAQNFLVRVDVTDANNETRTSTQSVSVSLAPPTSCTLEYIAGPRYLKVTWANSGDAGVSTQVDIARNGAWTNVATVDPGLTSYFYTLGTQTGLFEARVRHVKAGYNASTYCNTNGVTV